MSVHLPNPSTTVPGTPARGARADAGADVIGAGGRSTSYLRGPHALHRIFAVVDGAAAISGTLVAGVAAGLSPGGVAVLALAAALTWLLLLEVAGLYAHDDPPSWTVGVGEVRRLALLGLLLSWPAVGLAAALGAARPALGGVLAAVLATAGTVLGRAGGRTLAHRSRPLRQG
ncbi:MAG TPA: hypothetical protein VGI54_05295, partial [Solirubrobacteraceae bacterium]